MSVTFDAVFMGTSLTAGSGSAWNGSVVLDGGSYVTLVPPALAPGAQKEVRSYNLGVPGWDSLSARDIVYKTALLRPNVAVMEYSMNDCNGAVMTVAQAKTNTQFLITAILAASPATKIFLMTMNPVIGAASRADVTDYYQAYRDMVIANPTLGLIDNYSAWAGATLAEIPDGIHPLLAQQKLKLIPAIVTALGPYVNL